MVAYEQPVTKRDAAIEGSRSFIGWSSIDSSSRRRERHGEAEAHGDRLPKDTGDRDEPVAGREVHQDLAAERDRNSHRCTGSEPDIAGDKSGPRIHFGERKGHEEGNRITQPERRQLQWRRKMRGLDAEIVVADVNGESVRKRPPCASPERPRAMSRIVPC